VGVSQDLKEMVLELEKVELALAKDLAMVKESALALGKVVEVVEEVALGKVVVEVEVAVAVAVAVLRQREARVVAVVW